jgi:hypothetical protein
MSFIRDLFRKNHLIGPPERTLAVSSGPRSLYVNLARFRVAAKELRNWDLYQLAGQVAQNKRRVIALSNDVNENSDRHERFAPVRDDVDSGLVRWF